MRISDWSSDVCSSDLGGLRHSHISFVHSGRHPGQASARLLYLGEREPGSRANVRALALDPRLKAEGDDESWWRHWCDHRQRCVNSVARQEGAETRAPAAAMDTLSERSIPIPFQRRCALSTSINLSFVKQFERARSAANTTEPQSLMRNSYSVLFLKK